MAGRLLVPRSLTGQMMALVAVALFVAQAVNFTVLLGERRAFRFEQVVGPAAVRLVDATERESAGRPLSASRGRVRLLPYDPITRDLPRRDDIATALRRALGEAGLKVGAIDTGIRTLAADDRRLRYMPRSRAARIPGELRIAVERPGRGWLVLATPWPRDESFILWRLIAQTLVLYVIVLLPVLWIARRIARPLRALGDAARGFAPGVASVPLAEHGPADVRAVIVAFNQLRLRVTAMLDEKDRMLGAIGHDLRTPLAALRVRIESVEDEADRARMADTIEEMNRTLDDILSLARLGRPSEPPTEVDLAALVDAVVEDFRDLGADVTFEETSRLPLRLRSSLMRRAVRNLIENAIKYGEAATVSVTPSPDTVTITVADRGAGIPAERMEEVFDPFTRLEGSRNRETGGIGLGLALARAIVRDAGGDIHLANRLDGGLAATIALPRR